MLPVKKLFKGLRGRLDKRRERPEPDLGIEQRVARLIREGNVGALEAMHLGREALSRIDALGDTPATLASFFSQLPILSFLKEQGVDLCALDSQGRSPADMAATYHGAAVIRWLASEDVRLEPHLLYTALKFGCHEAAVALLQVLPPSPLTNFQWPSEWADTRELALQRLEVASIDAHFMDLQDSVLRELRESADPSYQRLANALCCPIEKAPYTRDEAMRPVAWPESRFVLSARAYARQTVHPITRAPIIGPMPPPTLDAPTLALIDAVHRVYVTAGPGPARHAQAVAAANRTRHACHEPLSWQSHLHPHLHSPSGQATPPVSPVFTPR